MALFQRPKREGPPASRSARDDDPRVMYEHIDWPFPGGAFPSQLGAVMQRTVFTGELPALTLIHTNENSWIVGDGVNDPNLPGACLAAHLAHAIAFNSSLAGLADLPPGWQATRDAPGSPWRREPFEWLGDDEPWEPRR